MSVNNNFPFVPQNLRLDNQYLRYLRESTNSAMRGKINCTGEFTLTANAASTAVTEKLCTANSVVLLMPKTANAAGAIATTYITPASGSFTVTHANNAQTDKDFRYVVIG
jgi:hypothetical protein